MENTLDIVMQIIAFGSVLVLGSGMLFLAFVLRRFLVRVTKIEASLNRIADDARPVLDRARAVGENLNYMVMTVRKEVERAGDTLARANERLIEAIDGAEERVRELGAVIDVAKDEVEETILTASSALRGIRTGARMLAGRRRRGAGGSEETEVESDE